MWFAPKSPFAPAKEACGTGMIRYLTLTHVNSRQLTLTSRSDVRHFSNCDYDSSNTFTHGYDSGRSDLRRYFAPSFHSYCVGLDSTNSTPPKEIDRIPLFQIHGDRDRTFPIRYTRADTVVCGGGHALPITHANEVAARLIEIADSDDLAAGQTA